jgi:outer membrane protein OmpA-like peptidoglycan-associated protein
MKTKKPFLALSVGLLALTACTEAQLANSNPSAGGGAAIGALTGAVIGGALADGDNRSEGALIGAALGAGAGALIGQDLARQKAELDNSFANGQIDVINTGSELIVRMPQDILFPVSGYTVAPSLASDLQILAGSLNRYPNSIVTVTGHTDSTGSAAYNQTLSERRAESVAAILRSSGVNPNRIRTVGAGENQPIASNLTEEGRALNRRVDITITPLS